MEPGLVQALCGFGLHYCAEAVTVNQLRVIILLSLPVLVLEVAKGNNASSFTGKLLSWPIGATELNRLRQIHLKVINQ